MPAVLTRQFERDPAKAKSREFMKQKVLERFPDGKQRESLKAVFLTGPSLVEFDQIYRPLGLDPKNVTGIERDPEVFRRVKEQNDSRPEAGRINLAQCDAADLFSRGQKFNIISLDFLQNYGPDVLGVLDAIFEPDRDCIGGDALLLINTQAARESSKYLWRLAVMNMLAHSLATNDYLVYENETLFNKTTEKTVPDSECKTELVEVFKRTYEIITARGFSEEFRILEYEELLETTKKGLGALRAVDLVSWTRSGMFSEVFLRAQYLALRSLTFKELFDMFNRNSHSEDEKRRNLNMIMIFGVNTYPMIVDPSLSANLFSSNREFREPIFFAAVGQLCFNSFYMALCRKLAMRANIKITHVPEGALLQAGSYLNLLQSISVHSHETFGYTSESHTSMLLHAFSLENPSEKSTCDLQMKVRGALAWGEYKYFWLDFLTSKKSEIVSIRNEMERKYKHHHSIDRILQDSKIWRRYRHGQKLLNMIDRISCSARGCGETMNQQEELFDAYHRIIREKVRANLPQIIGIQKVLTQESEENASAPNPSSDDVAETKAVPSRTNLASKDKEAIRELAREGYSPKEIHETLFAGTDVTRAQVASICAWNKIRAKRAAGGGSV